MKEEFLLSWARETARIDPGPVKLYLVYLKADTCLQ
jgi:hypothetical protein